MTTLVAMATRGTQEMSGKCDLSFVSAVRCGRCLFIAGRHIRGLTVCLVCGSGSSQPDEQRRAASPAVSERFHRGHHHHATPRRLLRVSNPLSLTDMIEPHVGYFCLRMLCVLCSCTSQLKKVTAGRVHSLLRSLFPPLSIYQH